MLLGLLQGLLCVALGSRPRLKTCLRVVIVVKVVVIVDIGLVAITGIVGQVAVYVVASVVVFEVDAVIIAVVAIVVVIAVLPVGVNLSNNSHRFMRRFHLSMCSKRRLSNRCS